MSFLVLLVDHEPEISGPTDPTTASSRHWHPECFFFREQKQYVLCVLTIVPLLMVHILHNIHFTDLVLNRYLQTILFVSIATLSFALLQHSSMPADNQLGDHGDL